MIKKRGQTAIEQSLLIIVVLAGFLAMSQYLKRGIQGRWKKHIDEFGDQYDPLISGGSTVIRETDTTARSDVYATKTGSGLITERFDSTQGRDNKKSSFQVGPQSQRLKTVQPGDSPGGSGDSGDDSGEGRGRGKTPPY